MAGFQDDELTPLNVADEASAAIESATADQRPPMPEPPPVRIIAVADVVLPCPPGIERALDAFFVGMLRFEREDETLAAKRQVEAIEGLQVAKTLSVRHRPPLPVLTNGATPGPVYRAERFRICFEVLEPPIKHESLRPIGIEVPVLSIVEAALIAAEIEFVRQKGIVAGQESLLTQDPAGNWMDISAIRPVN